MSKTLKVRVAAVLLICSLSGCQSPGCLSGMCSRKPTATGTSCPTCPSGQCKHKMAETPSDMAPGQSISR